MKAWPGETRRYEVELVEEGEGAGTGLKAMAFEGKRMEVRF